MILAVVRAAIRGSKSAEMRQMDVESRRVPLDRVRDVILDMEDRYGIPVDSSHVNPLAAAYVKLKLTSEATSLLACLPDRKIRCETDDDIVLNINDVQSKSRESYALLVSGGVAKGDWKSAVTALSRMTDAGLYPTDRQVSVWNESAAKRERRGRHKRRSWKKRRDEYWLQSLQ
uniref:Pentacotripeptide-repeat region of PRORP domain-containing protein n=1 Tax=Minutocellus polymorphus TaxID=265543 RepID=A0A7S0FSL4_9STRA|mmetsp:Transcript_7152/g.11913  ORF Transcript_7152/g.11913 Transcript_7152/m.11913 type:complete len:174 (+) Transcript_7152:29-550(+)